jgi:hypothetical protein
MYSLPVLRLPTFRLTNLNLKISLPEFIAGGEVSAIKFLKC